MEIHVTFNQGRLNRGGRRGNCPPNNIFGGALPLKAPNLKSRDHNTLTFLHNYVLIIRNLNLFETWPVVKKQRVDSTSSLYHYQEKSAEIIEIDEDSDIDEVKSRATPSTGRYWLTRAAACSQM